jgi:hypothetical protein
MRFPIGTRAAMLSDSSNSDEKEWKREMFDQIGFGRVRDRIRSVGNLPRHHLWIVSSRLPGTQKEQYLIQIKPEMKRTSSNQLEDGNLSVENQTSV